MNRVDIFTEYGTHHGTVIEHGGAIYVQDAADDTAKICIGVTNGVAARKYAHAILKLLGDEVPGEKPKADRSALKGEWSYLAVREPEQGHSYVMSAPFYKQNIMGSVQSTVDFASSQESGAFSVYEKVAYVGAKPATQREVITVG